MLKFTFIDCGPLGKMTPPFLIESANFAFIFALVWPFV